MLKIYFFINVTKMDSKNLDGLCVNKEIAENKFEIEMQLVGHVRGCEGYRPCLDCDGLNEKCDKYYNWGNLNHDQKNR